MRSIIRLRQSKLLFTLTAGASLLTHVLLAQSDAMPASARLSGGRAVPIASRRGDHRLVYIRALLDAAPAELAESGNVLRAFGFASSDTSTALRGLSIAVLDTTGERIALLLGDGATIDAIPREARHSLATAAVIRGLGSRNAGPDASTATLRTQNERDSLTLVFVKAVPRSAARCDCLLDTDGAIVAALAASGSATFLLDDGLLAETFAPPIERTPPPPRPFSGSRSQHAARSRRSPP